MKAEAINSIFRQIPRHRQTAQSAWLYLSRSLRPERPETAGETPRPRRGRSAVPARTPRRPPHSAGAGCAAPPASRSGRTRTGCCSLRAPATPQSPPPQGRNLNSRYSSRAPPPSHLPPRPRASVSPGRPGLHRARLPHLLPFTSRRRPSLGAGRSRVGRRRRSRRTLGGGRPGAGPPSQRVASTPAARRGRASTHHGTIGRSPAPCVSLVMTQDVGRDAGARPASWGLTSAP